MEKIPPKSAWPKCGFCCVNPSKKSGASDNNPENIFYCCNNEKCLFEWRKIITGKSNFYFRKKRKKRRRPKQKTYQVK